MIKLQACHILNKPITKFEILCNASGVTCKVGALSTKLYRNVSGAKTRVSPTAPQAWSERA